MEQKLISVKDFTPEELRKWQLRLLEILVYFRDFCEKHNLRFFLSAGTCLGAVRHHGFIPWDDDLDVAMPRSDYMKLLELWPKEADTSRFVCETTTKDKCIRFPMSLIRSKGTTCIYNHSVNDDLCHGLKIDVEFLDGVPNSKIGKKVFNIVAGLLGFFRTQRLPQRWPKKTKIQAKILLSLIPKPLMWKFSVLLERWLMRTSFDSDCEYVRYLTVRPFLKSSFKEAIYTDFEGYKMPIPIGYDEHLTSLYGNYMELPPEDKRKPATDNLVFYDLDHSYLDYRGKYYCVEK